MGETIGIREHLRGAMVPALCILISGYFAGHALFGATGLFAWGDYRAEQAELGQVAAALAVRKQSLERKVALLNPHHVDPDLADELVRGNLGVIREDEVVVPLPETHQNR